MSALAAAGKGNPAVIEHSNGGTWSIVSLPVSGTLHGLSAVSANDVWAVGSGGLILNWNGTQWSQVANPAGQGASLAAVAALSANDAWAINLNGTVTEQWNGTVDGRAPGKQRCLPTSGSPAVSPGAAAACPAWRAARCSPPATRTTRLRSCSSPSHNPRRQPRPAAGLTALWISDRDALSTVLSMERPLVSFAELTALRPLNAYVPD